MGLWEGGCALSFHRSKACLKIKNQLKFETTAVKHSDKWDFMISFVLIVAMYINWLTCCVAISQHTTYRMALNQGQQLGSQVQQVKNSVWVKYMGGPRNQKSVWATLANGPPSITRQLVRLHRNIKTDQVHVNKRISK